MCLNTLGQDREFTPEQIRYALDTVKLYRNEWERIEKANLRKDIDRKLDNMDAERMYKEVHEPMDIAEADKRAEEAVSLQEGNEPLEEFARTQALKKHKWDLLTKMFYDPDGAVAHKRNEDNKKDGGKSRVVVEERLGTPNTSGDGPSGMNVDEKYEPLAPEYWKQPFLDLKELHVLKMPRVLQSLFYLLQYEREQIAEHDTNKLDFKKAKSLIGDDLFERMSQYNPLGSRE